MDGSEFGRFGVLRFMRRHEDTVIASYPIDEEELTFGCDPTCSVRLYYPTVSPIHAKIFFQERKAFIEVLGVHGLFVDKCRVFPTSKPTHTTVPLSNNSELEINKKRFRFEYPPKALRPVLAFTPSASTSKSARKRVLRLSMIQSAQVFTPRPDPDPRVNLRVLQTPIRLNCSPLKHSFKQEQDDQQQDEVNGTPIRLVEGNRPQVVEEEQDLVILEEVDAPEPPCVQSAAHAPQAAAPNATPGFPLSPSHQPQQFQTPRRRAARPSLHRSVLIRSAQRAAMRFEMEKEEEQEEEEREVEAHVTPIEERMEVDEEGEVDQDAVIEEFNEDYEETEPDSKPAAPIFGWRKSLEVFRSGLHALRSPSRSPEREEYMEQDIAEAHEDFEKYTEDEPLDRDDDLQEPKNEEGSADASHGGEAESESDQGASTPCQITPQRPEQHFYFRTPQTHRSNSLADRVRGRQSTGGAAWASLIKPSLVADDPVPAVDTNTPLANAESRERRISQLERRAIQERRRSALTQPDQFFGENIPGSRRNSLGPDAPTPKATFGAASPSKIWPDIKEDEEEVETTMLLEKMKEVVEGMQRRRSLQPEAFSILNKTEICDEDMVLEEETPKDDEPTVEEQYPPQADSSAPVHSFPPTPQMSDLRHVFSEKRAAGMPTSYAGVRELFKAENARNPETPRLDGVSEVFFRARRREPSTPIFQGVDEMLVTPPEYASEEPAGQSEESAPEVTAPAPTPLPKQGSGAAAKTRVRGGRETPTDASHLADNELTPDDPPAKPSKHSAKAPKGSVVRRTTRRAEAEAKEETAPAPAKSVSKARKLVTPEPSAQPKPTATRLESGRRSRTTTKSSESTDQEPAEASKPTRKTPQGTKAPATTTPDPEPEPEPEPAKSVRRGARRGQQADVGVAPMTKRRTAKSKADDASDASARDDPPEPEAPLLASRPRRGKGKSAEPEDGSTGTQRATQSKRTPAATVKARATASSAKSARGVLEKEKENTPERVHVKEEDEMQQQQQQPPVAVAVKGVRTRKATSAAQRAAHSEPERDADTVKTRARAPRTRAASGRK
ncbi:hypothetical protein EI94DRAFT_1794990 [Lactarius quietus]|nr:hypothetical protein EI94DRAFT_1794990 [Lactarius quietus]